MVAPRDELESPAAPSPALRISSALSVAAVSDRRTYEIMILLNALARVTLEIRRSAVIQSAAANEAGFQTAAS